MAGDVKKLMTQGRTFWTSLSPMQKAILVVGVLAAAGVTVFMSLRGSMDTFTPLYTGQSPDDTAQMEIALQSAGIPYTRQGDTGLRVPPEKLADARMIIAAAGINHKGGAGWEIFDKQRFGTSGFVEQANYIRVQQGELERSLVGTSGVKSARVHIAMPERGLFRDSQTAPSASVQLKLAPGRILSPVQVRGMVNFVAFSVPGLQPERVSIVDDSGRSLSEQVSGNGAGPMMDVQHGMEEGLSSRVRTIIERSVGEGNVEVQVSLDVDFTRETTTQELFDKDGAVLRNEQRTQEASSVTGPTSSGVAGAAGNLPGAPAATPGSASGSNGVISESKNWEISKTMRQVQGGQPRIKKQHVAILINGVPDPAVKPVKGKPTPMIPRTDAQLAALSALAKQAIGFDDARGDKMEIKSAVFAEAPVGTVADEPVDEWPSWMRSPKNQLLMKAGGLLFVILAGFAAIVVLVRSVRLRRSSPELILPELPRHAREIEAHLSDPNSMANMMAQAQANMMPPPPPQLQLPSVPEAAKPRDLALAAAKKDVGRTVRVLSNWLTETTFNTGTEK